MAKDNDSRLPVVLQAFGATTGPRLDRFLDSSSLDEATVWLETADTNFLEAVCSPRNPRLPGFRQPVGRGLISQVLLTGLPLLEPDVANRHDHDPTVDGLTGIRTRSLFAAPLTLGGDVVGVLSAVILESPDGESKPNPEDLEAFAELARQVSADLPDPLPEL